MPFVVTIHDLIPLINAPRYLDPHPDFKTVYLEKIETLKLADALIAISESARGEAIEYLGFDPDKIVNASEAADDAFQPRHFDEIERAQLLERFGVHDRFVFYTGGADPRKNLLRLVDGFAALDADVKDTHQLVLAGSMPDFEVNEIKARAVKRGVLDRLVFTSYISDDDLISLFSLAEVFVFPSMHEGFGLPPLEAMQCGTAAIGSDCSSIPEVIGNPEALFDPHNTKSISTLLNKVLTDPAFKKQLATQGFERAKTFSWMRSAELILEQLERFAKSRSQSIKQKNVRAHLDQVEERFLRALHDAQEDDKLNELEENSILQNWADNRTALERAFAQRGASGNSWRMEGPFDSSYSLASVNRELAIALEQSGQQVALWSSEGPGDFDPDPDFLSANPSINKFYQRARGEQARTQPETLSRNMYPPRVTDIDHPNAALHNYAWEETAMPNAFAQSFNEYLRFITVTSQHCKKTLIDNGIDLPIAVVGNGVDHWDRIVADANYIAPGKTTKILHVSSCFPRKGADVLLSAFGKAFSKTDDVSLIIKTFENPHNHIAKQLERLRNSEPGFPHVEIIFDDMSDAQLKSLYEQSDILVAPSRAEGFGLPIAEAMLSGLRVIATGWSGQLDFCNVQNSQLVDYSFARADTHEDIFDSVWAEPDADHLARLMREACANHLGPTQKQERANELRRQFNWLEVAKRNIVAAHESATSSLPKIGWITTFRKRCGIATYSAHLLAQFDLPVAILADDQAKVEREDKYSVVPCWVEGGPDDLSTLCKEIRERKLDVIHLQFNYGFFDFEHLNKFLLIQHNEGRSVVVTLHSTIDPAHDPARKLALLKAGLDACDRLLVHSINDLNRLKGLGLDRKATLLPHGCLTIPNIDSGEHLILPSGNVKLTLAAYGFLLPNKGILELVEAVMLLRDDGVNCHLKLVNARYPANVSKQLEKHLKDRVLELELNDFVEMHHEFLTDNESFQLLKDVDLLVYPYQQTGESASGAVRYGIATGKPVLVSPSPIFDDVADAVHYLPGARPKDIADGVREIVSSCNKNDESFFNKARGAKRWREAHGYPTIGRRLSGLMRALHRNKSG